MPEGSQGIPLVEKLILALSLMSALMAGGASFFWFRSAARDLPPMRAYWDQTPPDDPLFQSLQAGIADNRTAAMLAGLSAAFMAAATLAQVKMRYAQATR